MFHGVISRKTWIVNQLCCESLECRQMVFACTVKGTSHWAVQLNIFMCIGQCSWTYSCVLGSAVEHIHVYLAVQLNIFMCFGQCSWTQFILGSAVDHTNLYCPVQLNTIMCIGHMVEHIYFYWAILLNNLVYIGQCGWTRYFVWRCMNPASSYSMFINQQDAQNSCD